MSERTVKCPECGHEASYNLFSLIPDKQRMQFKIVPGESGLLSAETVGGTLAEMQKLLRAMGKEHGEKMNVSVCGIEYDNGAVTFDLLLTAIRPAKKGRTP